ncbi:Decaprenyl diphosphate synthase-like protein [Cantharellus anzutake]|uniref:Decaprenyl diphosphate synthase-like protein n=1 Tax=Cantharellus anzutake TaxID=1750568 RepID=UPI001906FF93|nr:Decaprenyl diphosphate synthase-like protein [Cantharellus anzutake]KAF8320604.1 Decaprenyl diphosphate synthase-like protein [Cantharellus anzutake]
METVYRILLDVISAGPMPRHVAFIMDGNRRYAKLRKRSVREGHKEGFQALKRVLEICFRLGVKCVSVYAFSIENFKRSPDEVNALMDLAREKIKELCSHGELLSKYGVRLNVVGNRDLLPVDLQQIILEAEEKTRGHDKAIFNLCMSYTSRDEITTAINNVVQKYHAGEIGLEDITEQEIASHLETHAKGSPRLDVMIRTSGVKRLSDYMLWQASTQHTRIYFTKGFWPDFGLWDLLPIIFDYQKSVWRGS